jgi:hypothetical protein
MKRSSFFQSAPFSLAAYIPAMFLLASALSLLAWAFFQPELTPDQRIFANVFSALLCGSAGFLWGGVILDLRYKPAPNLKVAIQALGGSAIFLLGMWHPLFPPADAGQRETVRLLSSPRRKLEITRPGADSVVGSEIEVRGSTSYPAYHHYIVVSGSVAGGDAVQDDTLKLSPAGELVGTATIGSSAVGAGQTYTIRIIASKTPLKPGPLVQTSGLIFSNPVTVTRSAQAERS